MPAGFGRLGQNRSSFRKNLQKKDVLATNNQRGSILIVRVIRAGVFFSTCWRGIMESLHSTADMIRKVALFTLVGFLAVFLIGPVLTVLGLVLPFALVGFLVWLPFRLLVQKREINWSGLPQKAGQILRTVLSIPVRIVATVLSIPIRIVAFIASAVIGLLRLVGGLLG